METILHTATLNDVRELAEMNRMLIDDEGAGNPMSVDDLEKRMRRWLESGEYYAVLMTHNDSVVGYLLYREERDAFDISRTNIYVRQYFVKRAYRRRGIGRTAFDQIAQAHFPPEATVILEVLATNIQGRAFWEQLGFQPYYTTYRRTAAVATD